MTLRRAANWAAKQIPLILACIGVGALFSHAPFWHYLAAGALIGFAIGWGR